MSSDKTRRDAAIHSDVGIVGHNNVKLCQEIARLEHDDRTRTKHIVTMYEPSCFLVI